MKSRHQREVSELKEQVHRANLASERDQALREKVFNEAKAEVMALSKKVYRIILIFCFVSSVSFSFFYVRSILFGVALRITITMVVQLWWRKLNIVNPVLWGNCCFLIFLLSFSYSRFPPVLSLEDKWKSYMAHFTNTCLFPVPLALFFFQQLEEKTRRLRELEKASHMWEGRIRQLEKEKLELETKVKQTREALDEHVARLSKQVICAK